MIRALTTAHIDEQVDELIGLDQATPED